MGKRRGSLFERWGAEKGIYGINLYFRNLLYVYPLSVNYTSRSSSARNIAVKVQFLGGEEMPPLEVGFVL